MYCLKEVRDVNERTLNSIRESIEALFKTDPNIHINVAVKSPKCVLQNAKAVIKEVYPHIFIIEEADSDKKTKRHTLQYSDILIGQIEILEMNN